MKMLKTDCTCENVKNIFWKEAYFEDVTATLAKGLVKIGTLLTRDPATGKYTPYIKSTSKSIDGIFLEEQEVAITADTPTRIGVKGITRAYNLVIHADGDNSNFDHVEELLMQTNGLTAITVREV